MSSEPTDPTVDDVLAGLNPPPMHGGRPVDLGALFPLISRQVACHVLGYFGHSEGWVPGACTAGLLLAMIHADRENGQKLCAGWPDYYAAQWFYRNDVVGLTVLLAIAQEILD